MNVIEIQNVSFGYAKNKDIIADLNMNIPEGSIYGFLGPNGAGKTTTLKLILNLLKNKRGHINIFDKDITKTYPNYLSKIGSLIENSSLYDHLSAKDNLRIWSNYFKNSQDNIDQILETIGLDKEQKKKVRAFSTGMKQRLGLGIALLHNPKILILDEPTNGLDPIAITTLRKILFKLRDEGKTILLSSHILSEVEKVVSHVGILKEGKLAFEGQINELHKLLQSNIDVVLKVNESQKAFQLLTESYNVELLNDTLEFKVDTQDEINDIISLCIQNNVKVFEIYKKKSDLEQLFINISNSVA